MSRARGLCNQKLYYAAVQLKGLGRALAEGTTPERVLLEAYGQAIQGHLQDAYGWFLLELAGATELSRNPPVNVSELRHDIALAAPLRGELVELQALESRGDSWLARLLAAPHHRPGSPTPGTPQNRELLASSAGSLWSSAELESWYQSLVELTDRMGDSLDEW